MHLPFQNATNFLNLPSWTTEPFVVLGLGYDGATSFRSGARFGPQAIRQSSLMLTDGHNPNWPVDLTSYVGDGGDLPLVGTMIGNVLNTVAKYIVGLNNVHPVCLGGDHSLTLGILRALVQKHGPLAVVHFDAHCDTWDNHFGEPVGHGTWLYNAIEEKLVVAERTISIGVRSPVDSQTKNYLGTHGGTTLSAASAMDINPRMMADIIDAKIGTQHPVYLSLDIDCLDPSQAPGTGTPEIAGLTTMWLTRVLDSIASLNWKGMDLVEVNPLFDHQQITSLAAATFCWQYLSMNVFKSSKNKPA